MKVYLRTVIVSAFVCFFANLLAQERTVGLIAYEEGSYNGYTLFSPMASDITYLIDNCGEKVNEWNFESLPGLLAYLHTDGSIFRGERSAGSFGAGGAGGKIVHKSWDDELIWSYLYSDDLVRQHHDFQVLPNGNVLVLAWERKTKEEAVNAGRIESLTGSDGVWFEHIVELKPIGLDSAEIVWEWHVFDHLIQERDSTAVNYGEVDQSPNKFHINYKIQNQFSPNQPGNPDWMHMNSIQYNVSRDEIMLSSRDFDEIYIIDHSTTTAEAKTGEGGNSGKGGDILFRWGNNAAYNKADVDDRLLFAQHHASWVSDVNEADSRFTVFNNGIGNGGFETSSIEFVTPSLVDGKYVLTLDGIFMTDDHVTINDNEDLDFSSPRLSSIQVLQNDNILIASGNNGRIVEVTPDGELVWDYINPVNNSGPITQGENVFANDIFRAMRYSIASEIFENRDLVPDGIVEVDPDYEQCFIIDTTLSLDNSFLIDVVDFYPNPVQDFLNIKINEAGFGEYQILDLKGRQHATGQLNTYTSVSMQNFLPGVYCIKLMLDDKVQVFKIIKI